ncbi:hypothetical protein [Geodermatophilus nigrescens]|uniref:hypothetical protein n=1 Tax=Geodermatophilus nigrescens TaxID=1070870 RepID=UPI001114DB06|nr:hypothetical protein [Geodermatophilus nigrescens]
MDPDVLAQGEPHVEPDGEVTGWTTDPAFLVSPGDTQDAVEAVLDAADRMVRVEESGRELEVWESSDAYTAPWTGVYRTGQGLVVAVDTEGYLARAHGEGLVAVLVDSLSARGVSASVSAAPEVVETDEPIERPAPPARDRSADLTFVWRPVGTWTTTGVPYTESEYWCADGRWTRDRSEAASFQGRAPEGLVDSLRAQPQPERTGEVTTIILPADPAYEPLPLPPEEIRAPR